MLEFNEFFFFYLVTKIEMCTDPTLIEILSRYIIIK